MSAKAIDPKTKATLAKVKKGMSKVKDLLKDSISDLKKGISKFDDLAKKEGGGS